MSEASPNPNRDEQAPDMLAIANKIREAMIGCLEERDGRYYATEAGCVKLRGILAMHGIEATVSIDANERFEIHTPQEPARHTCGGPAICCECARDLARKQSAGPGATFVGEDSVSTDAESSRPQGLLTSNQRVLHICHSPCLVCENERMREALVSIACTSLAVEERVREYARKALSGDSPSAPETRPKRDHLTELAQLLEFKEDSGRVQVIAGKGEQFWELMAMVKEHFTL